MGPEVGSIRRAGDWVARNLLRGARAGAWAFALFILISMASLSPDLAFRGFDALVPAPSLRPSQWLSIGDLYFAGALFVVMLSSRRQGAGMAIRAWCWAWGMTVVLAAILVAALLSDIEPGDWPSLRFVLAYFGSWFMAGGVVAATYHALRGMMWWKPAFIGLAIGLSLQAIMFHLILFTGTRVPWGLWMLAQTGLWLMLSLLALLPYLWLRPRVIPLSGLGGR